VASHNLPSDPPVLTTVIVNTMLLPALLCVFTLACSASHVADNEIIGSRSRKINSGEELLSAVVGDCFTGSDSGASPTSCLRLKVLKYLDSVVGVQDARSLEQSDAEQLDAMILSRVTRYLKSHEFKVHLPDFLFQEATLTFRPGKSLVDFKVEFPKPDASEDRAVTEGNIAQYICTVEKFKFIFEFCSFEFGV
jgi:Protein of unknown function (DUF1676).